MTSKITDWRVLTKRAKDTSNWGTTMSAGTTADPARPAPPGFKWQVLFRAKRSEAWVVLVETATGEEAWDCMCSNRANGEYRPQLVRIGLFDADERGGR